MDITDISWHITANIHGKRIRIPVGDASQKVKWMASVAIARFDEETHQGWKILGVPTAVRNAHHAVDMNSAIRDALQSGDEVFIATSMQPNEEH
jgi:hypothetical protein